MRNKIEIFKSKDNQVELHVQMDADTVWLTQEQIVLLFGRDQSVISRHINNVFNEKELDKESNMQKMHIANSDKPVALYNLDVIISVGYRVKSQRGTQFRQWATQRLKDYLVQGYAINEKRLAQKQQEDLTGSQLSVMPPWLHSHFLLPPAKLKRQKWLNNLLSVY